MIRTHKFTIIVSALLYILPHALAQGGGCTGFNVLPNPSNSLDNGNGTANHCNVDPSQENYGVANAIDGVFCANGGVTVNSNIWYTGIDNVVSSALATPTVVAATTSATVFVQYTSLPYSSIKPDSPMTFDLRYTYTGQDSKVTSQGGLFAGIVDFTQTIFYTDTTVLSTATVPSTVTASSTLTNQVAQEADPQTTTITSGSGVATETAAPTTTTSTRTIQRPTTTQTTYIIKVKTKHASCLPQSTAASVPRKRLAKRYSEPYISIAPSSFLLPYCTDGVLPYTTFTTATDYSTTQVTSGETTVTVYDSTETTSFYTRTDTVLAYSASSTVTTTPTLTARTNTVVPRKTKKMTYTSVRTVTRYPKHPVPCSTVTTS